MITTGPGRYCNRPRKNGQPCRQPLHSDWQQACTQHATAEDDDVAKVLEAIDVAAYTRGFRNGWHDGFAAQGREQENEVG